MKKGDLTKENINELVFPIYCEFGGKNFSRIVKSINKKHGMKVSVQTLYEWEKKYNFAERLKNIDEERRKAIDNRLSLEDQMLNTLLEQKNRYEKYFATLSTPDHQAQYVLQGIITTIIKITTMLSSFKAELFTSFMKDLILYLQKNDPGAVQVIEKNFDGFMAEAKEKYANK